MGELEKPLEYLSRSLSISETTENKYDIARAISHQGLVLQDKGELKTALEYYNRSLALFETHGSKLSIAVCLTNIGRIYRDLGEVDLALEYLNKSLALIEMIGDPERIATTVANIGSVNWKKGQLAIAEEYLKRSLDIRESLGTDLYRSHHLFYLLRLSLDQKKHNQAKAYLSQLESLHDRSPDKLTQLYFQLGEALMLKTSHRFIKKARAQKLLLEIVTDETMIQYYGGLAMIHLCELYLDELKAYGDVEVFREAKTLVDKFYTLAHKERSFTIEVNVLILQAKFTMVEGDLIKSTALLKKAMDTAEKKGLGALMEKVSFEMQRLEEQVYTWHQLIQSNAPLQERLRQAQLIEYVKIATKIVNSERL